MVEHAWIREPFIDAIAILGIHECRLSRHTKFPQQRQQQRRFGLAISEAPLPRLVRSCGTEVAGEPGGLCLAGQWMEWTTLHPYFGSAFIDGSAFTDYECDSTR
jgi:hypothetical protein